MKQLTLFQVLRVIAASSAVAAALGLSAPMRAADSIQVSVKNNWKSTIEVYVYNGSDTARWSIADEFYVKPGEVGSGYCAGQGKGRCHVKVRKLRGNKPAETKWGRWVDDLQTCTVPADASGAKWDEITCR